MRWLVLVLAACAAHPAVAPVAVKPEAPQVARGPEPEASYRLRYVPGPPPTLEIAVTVASAAVGPTTFELGKGFADVEDPEASIRDVAARDEAGHALVIAQATPHTWRVTGPPGHRVTLTYTVFASHPPGFGDRFRTIVTEHLVHLVGSVALMWPADLGTGERFIRFAWDGLEAAHLQPATSFGSGRSIDVHDTFERFRESVFVASDALRRTTRQVGGGTLELAVTGAWGFTDDELADYIARVMTVERAFFEDPGPPYFFVNVLPLDGGAGSYGGTGYTHSFDLDLSPGFALDARLRSVIAHEQLHSWNGHIITPEAFETLTYWFTEGFTDFYTARLGYRAGLITLDDYVRAIDDALASYLRSPARDAPNPRTTGFWDDPFLRKLPYERGHVVALVADREIRRATGGKLSLDDVMRALVETGRKGATITSARVLAMLEGLTSSTVGAQLRATVLDGAVLMPSPALFEPCLTGTRAKVWTFELGFDFPTSRAGKLVTGVVPGSAAARAGLRDGEALGGYSVQTHNPDEPITLQVGPARRKVTYLPRGKQVETVQYAVHDASACAAVLGPALP